MSLAPAHIEDLKRSGLTDKTIESMRVEPVDPSVWLKSKGVETAYRLPYTQLNGCGPFWRDKLIPAATMSDGKRQRYDQPTDSGCRLYVLETIVESLCDRAQSLFVVEGEKKAAAGVQHGLLCVGIGGIWNYKIKGTSKLVPEFDSIPLDNREVNLVPDSDVWTRDDLLLAVHDLLMQFKIRGAHVYVVRLPDGKTETKPNGLGLDDFFLQSDIDAFTKLDRYTSKHSVWTRFREHFKQKIKMQSAADAGSATVKPEVRVSDADAVEARKLLGDPDLLATFLKDIEDAGCVGEQDNKTILLLACVSRLTKNPINITIKGESSAGKNYIAGAVTRFLPPETLHSISSATPKALFYLGEDLSHSVIVIAEAPGAEDASYSIRTLQSEGELTILVPEKREGRIETSERKVKGPVTFIETTTQTHLHAENETRCFDVYVDESTQQTEAIFNVQNNKALGLINETKIIFRLKLWHDAQRLLKPIPVQIPFAKHIGFPTRPLRVRRDRPRFLALIEASALLHQYQRTTKPISGVTHVVASVDDYENAIELSAAVLGRVLSGITPSCEKLVTAVSGIEGEFTRSDVQTEMKWSRATVDKYVREAVDLGCIEITEGRKGQTYKYRFVRLADHIKVELPARDQIEALMKMTEGGLA